LRGAQIKLKTSLGNRRNVPGEDVYLTDMAELLTQKHINRLPVTDPDGRLVGIITRSDIVNATLKSGTCAWTT
jgi:predicted transcriptional regulator